MEQNYVIVTLCIGYYLRCSTQSESRDTLLHSMCWGSRDLLGFLKIGVTRATSLRSVPAWRLWLAYIGPVVVGNIGDNSVSSYRLHVSETQQLSYVQTADATPCRLCGVARISRQPMTGRHAIHPTTTKLQYRLCKTVRESDIVEIGNESVPRL